MKLLTNKAIELFSTLYLNPKERTIDINGLPVNLTASSTLPLFCNTSNIANIKEVEINTQNGSSLNSRTDFKSYRLPLTTVKDRLKKSNFWLQITGNKIPDSKLEEDFLKEFNRLVDSYLNIGTRFKVFKSYLNPLTKNYTYFMLDKLLKDVLVIDGLFLLTDTNMSYSMDYTEQITINTHRIGANFSKTSNLTISNSLVTESTLDYTAELMREGTMKSSMLSRVNDLSIKVYVLTGGRDIPPTYDGMKTGIMYSWLDPQKSMQIARQETFPITCVIIENLQSLIGNNFDKYIIYQPSVNRYFLQKITDAKGNNSFGCFFTML